MAGEAELGGFLEAAGRSFTDAQGALSGDVVDLPPAVAIAEAELELKAAVQRRGDGAVVLETISTADMRSGAITPGLLSTIRVQYVAVAADTLTAPSQQPSRTPKDVIDDVRKRSDVAALDRILGGLRYEAVPVPGKRWLVTARDDEDRLVREVLVADEER
jgi:hypothetical protein